MANVEQDRLAKRIQEFRTQAELDSLRASSGIEPPDVGTNAAGANSYRDIETITTSTRGGEVIELHCSVCTFVHVFSWFCAMYVVN